MTPYERRHPEVLKASRKIRIAKGSGRSVEEVNRLLKQFEMMKDMMKKMSSGNFKMPFQVSFLQKCDYFSKKACKSVIKMLKKLAKV